MVAVDQPKYMQVMEYLNGLCRQSEPHDPIPSERDIASALSISRMTVRKAIEELCRQGVLYRNKNKGTFVAARTPQSEALPAEEKKRILFLDSLYDSSNVPEVQEAFRLKSSDRLFRLVRLVMRQDIPVRVEEIYAPTEEINDEDVNRLDQFFDLEACRTSGSSSAWLRPELVPAKYTRLMQLRPSTPVLCMAEQIRHSGGRPFLYVYTWFNPETSPFYLPDFYPQK